MVRSPALYALVLLASAAAAAPVPTHLFAANPPPYCPTTPGTKWVYEADGEAFHLVISKAERTAAGTEVTVERVMGEVPTDYQKLVVSPNGLVQTELLGVKLSKPWVLLRVPHKLGDTWKDDDSAEFGFTSQTSVVGGIEKVEVPAGAFEAVRVDSEYLLKGQKMKHTYWYTPGVGLVKSTGGGTRVLKSYTRGQE